MKECTQKILGLKTKFLKKSLEGHTSPHRERLQAQSMYPLKRGYGSFYGAIICDRNIGTFFKMYNQQLKLGSSKISLLREISMQKSSSAYSFSSHTQAKQQPKLTTNFLYIIPYSPKPLTLAFKKFFLFILFFSQPYLVYNGQLTNKPNPIEHNKKSKSFLLF